MLYGHGTTSVTHRATPEWTFVESTFDFERASNTSKLQLPAGARSSPHLDLVLVSSSSPLCWLLVGQLHLNFQIHQIQE